MEMRQTWVMRARQMVTSKEKMAAAPPAWLSG